MHDPASIGVIFDMDGVLIDSAPAHLRSWQVLARECGGTVTQEQFANTFGQQNCDIVPILFGKISEDRMRTLADRKEGIYRDLIRKRPPIVKGAVELVRGLYDAGVRLAVGSSGPRENIELALSAMNVGDCISVVVSGDEVARGKPDPEVFSLAANRLGVEPARCVVVEDAPVGVEAARAAGARVVAVLMHHPADAFGQADQVVPRLTDLSVEQLTSLACS